MRLNFQNLVMAGTVSLLAGCIATSDESVADISAIEKMRATAQVQSNIRDYSRFSARGHNKSLNDYAQQLVMELNTQQAVHKPIAVASFVEFDSALDKTNSIGNQLAEAVLIELGQMGYPTADINVSDSVRLQSNGNFAFSRQQSENAGNYCCVLSGNLIYEQGGVRVNAKLIDLKSKSILGASTLTIPYFVVEHLGYAQAH